MLYVTMLRPNGGHLSININKADNSRVRDKPWPNKQEDEGTISSGCQIPFGGSVCSTDKSKKATPSNR